MAGRRKTHGLYPLMTRVKASGMAGVDGRSVGYKAVMAWKQELLCDLGGQEHVSSQRLALVDMVARTRLFIDHLDSFLLEQKSLVNRRKKSILPILRERQGLVDSMSRLLGQLGLERQAKPVEDLHTYLARREREKEQEAQQDEEPGEIERDGDPLETAREEEGGE